MYKQIYEKLVGAKKSGRRDEIKKAVLYFVEQLQAVLSLQSKVLKKDLPFSSFVEDSGFIFHARKQSVFNDNGADSEVSTGGLLVELLTTYGLFDAKEVENKLKDTIFNLHSKLSKGNDDVKSDIKDLNSIFESIKNIMETE